VGVRDVVLAVVTKREENADRRGDRRGQMLAADQPFDRGEE
jgi:hypothetical protein